MSGLQVNMDTKLIIILCTAIPGTVIILIAVGVVVWLKRRRRGLFNRGITPIGDDEIATWKSSPFDEKQALRQNSQSGHTPTPSQSSIKSPSTIQYSTRPSLDVTLPPILLRNKISMDLPQAPGAAVIARAPNARSGLTDEIVPGDEPFVELRRQPSKLSKRPPLSGRTSMDQRGRGSRSNSMKTVDHGKSLDLPRHSSDGSRKGHSRIYSSSSVPPTLSSSELPHFSALSPPPPPSRGRPRENIGQAS